MLESIIAGGKGRLIWCQEEGVGFLDGDESGVYDEAYFDHYAALAASPVAVALNEFRSDLVFRHSANHSDGVTLLDVGIGDGAFLRSLEPWPWVKCFGADVNPAGISYLEARGQLGSLDGLYDVVTFWDSLEHIRDPRQALRTARCVALVSVPVFTSVEHVLTSKHYKPNEHLWYWTRAGFLRFVDREGFDVADILATETALGRDGIETFVLIRRAV